MTPLLGFTPDAATTTDGIITDCANWIPYESGMKAGPSAVAQGAAALGAATRGAATLTYLDNSRRFFVGTTAALYDLSGTTFTDRSRGGGYSLGTGVRWSFAQFGSASYAANIDTVVQKSTTGSFADVSGAPKAKVIESLVTSSGGFLFAFNTIDGTYGTSQDRWWCSALNNADDWVVAPTTTLCNTGRILGADGPITAAKKLGADRMVAYKDRGIYVGYFSGGSSVWSFPETAPDVGCVGMDAVVNLGTAHMFVGQDDIYVFDGARHTSIADGQVRQWFLDNSSVTYRGSTQMVYDRDAKLVWIFFPGASSTDGTPDKCLVYHLGTKQWGRADRTIETAVIYSTPTETYDAASGTYDSETDVFDATSPGSRVMSVFDSTHTMYQLTASPTSWYFTTGDIGDDEEVSRVTQVSLRYMTQPTSASMTAYRSMATGGNPSLGLTQSAYDIPSNGGNKFKLRQTARFHRFQFSGTGPCRVVGVSVDSIVPLGNR